MMSENQRYMCLPVIDKHHAPIGLISRYELQKVFMTRYGRELWERRPVIDLMNKSPLLISVKTALEQAAEAVTAQLQYPITEDFILVGEGGNYLGLGTVLDLLKAMARHLGRNRRVLMQAQQIAGLGSWEWQANTDRVTWSREVNRFLGIETFSHALLPEILELFEAQSQKYLKDFFYLQKAGPFELKFTSKEGETHFLELQGEHLLDPDTGEHHAVGTLLDITERRLSQERLAQLANFDHLTQLANRFLFQDRLSHALKQADRTKGCVALLFLDLDRFKWVNDALGHSAGDELLKQVAKRLTALLRSADTLARLGGDEFTVILENIREPAQATAVAEKIVCCLGESFCLGSRSVQVSTSLGIALYPADAQDSDSLLKSADRALYQAKELGRGRFCFYTQALDKKEKRRLELEQGLQHALRKGEFQVYFQPQLDCQTGRLAGAEALLRWFPESGPVSPAEFIPLLENLRLIDSIGRWVLEQACTHAAQWQQQTGHTLHVAVNLSVVQLRQPNFVSEVEAILINAGLPADRLIVEVTESVLLDDRGSAEALLSLARQGVGVAIDDFGTGYSSLVYLKRFAVNSLKLDQTFVAGLTVNKDDDAIANAIIALAHSLGLSVTAEGVETPAQHQFLAEHRCDQVQGYLVSRPLSATQFSDWIMTYTRQTPESLKLGC